MTALTTRTAVLCGLVVGTLIVSACGGTTLVTQPVVEEADTTPPDLTASPWQQDLDVLARELPRLHTNAWHTTQLNAWQDEVATARAAAPKWDSVAGSLEVQRLVALIGDGHTAAFSRLPSSSYGFESTLFADGVWILSAADNSAHLRNKQVLAINDRPVSDLIEAGRAWQSGDTPELRDIHVAARLNDPDFLAVLTPGRTLPDTITIDSDGSPETHELGLVLDGVVDTQDVLHLWQEQSDRLYWMTELPDHEAMYLNYRRAAPQVDYSMQQLSVDLIETSERNGAQRLIVDLRQNTGGSSEVIQPLVNALSDHPLGHDIVALIGPRTYSSGALSAIQLRDELGARLVGFPAGTTDPAYGEVRSFALPNSAMLVTYSVKYFDLGGDGLIQPDLVVPSSGRDHLAGVDAVLDAALALPPPN